MNVSTRLVLGALVLGLVISAPASFAMQDDGFNQTLAKKHTSSTMPDNCDPDNPDNPDDDVGCGGGGGHDNGNGGPDDTHDDGGCGGGSSHGGYSGGSDPDGSGGGLPF